MLDEIVKQIGPLAYLAIVVIGFFVVRTLRQIDINQKELWRHMDEHEKRLSTIEGAHDAIMRQGGHRG